MFPPLSGATADQPIALWRRGCPVDKAGGAHYPPIPTNASRSPAQDLGCADLRGFGRSGILADGGARAQGAVRQAFRGPRLAERARYTRVASECGMTLARGTERLKTERLVLRRGDAGRSAVLRAYPQHAGGGAGAVATWCRQSCRGMLGCGGWRSGRGRRRTGRWRRRGLRSIGGCGGYSWKWDRRSRYAACATVIASPATVVRRISRTCVSSNRVTRCMVWRLSHMTRSHCRH